MLACKHETRLKYMKLVIPTRLREELPEGFAYPLWPTKITDLLENTPQRSDAELVFHWRDELWESHWRKRILQQDTMKVVEAEYTPHWSPDFPKWKINIFSVPKQYLSAAQKILLNGGMQELATKLKAHGLTPREGVSEVINIDLAEPDRDCASSTEIERQPLSA